MARSRLRSVAHLVPALFGASGVVGGAERYAFELARHMAERMPTRLVTFGASPACERAGALEIVVVGPPHHVRGQPANPFAWGAIREALRADVVHCHQQHILVTTVAAALGRLRRRRVVCSDLGGGGWDVSAYVSTDRLFHAHLHISKYSRAVFGHEPLPRATVIYGGVDAMKFSPPPAGAARQIDCLFVGRLLPHKGVDTLIEAIPPGCRTLILGPAPDGRYLRDLHRLAAAKPIAFRHDSDDGALLEAYRSAKCVVLPSVYEDRYGGVTNVPELLGQTLLEGMACGAATIATAVASLPEVVIDGVTGFVVPPRDPARLRSALVSLLEQPALAARMGEAGRLRVLSCFSWEQVVSRCLEAYES
jgi:glycosyltransferase involved in cell wall biosynthesis